MSGILQGEGMTIPVPFWVSCSTPFVFGAGIKAVIARSCERGRMAAVDFPGGFIQPNATHDRRRRVCWNWKLGSPCFHEHSHWMSSCRSAGVCWSLDLLSFNERDKRIGIKALCRRALGLRGRMHGRRRQNVWSPFVPGSEHRFSAF
jgi:hypothetical protein